MPRYEYECDTCGTFEVNQRISDPPLSHHSCGSAAHRVISSTSFALKGGGWYADGYGPKGSSRGGEKKSSGSEAGASS